MIIVEPSFGWSVQRLLFEGVGAQGITKEISDLQQATVMKADLARLTELEKYAGSWSNGAEPVFVYSRYPFNFKNHLTIAAGSDQRVSLGDLVVVPVVRNGEAGTKPILIGRVIQVFPASALVQTVFDVGFQTAVRIGDRGVDALLTGGPEPRLTLISKTATVTSGDVVTAAASDMPYGLPIALVDQVAVAQNQVFQEASLAFGYDLNDLKIVTVEPRQSR